MAKIQTFNALLLYKPLLWHQMYSENYGTIKDLLVLQFAHWRSKKKELLELDPFKGKVPFKKKRVIIKKSSYSGVKILLFL